MSNVIAFSGRLGEDATKRTTPGGASVLSFSVASDTGYGDKKQTQWFRCAIWGKRADSALADYLVKGAQVFVTGELRASIGEGRDKSYLNLDVRVEQLDLMGGREGRTRPPREREPGADDERPEGEPFEDDIPF